MMSTPSPIHVLIRGFIHPMAPSIILALERKYPVKAKILRLTRRRPDLVVISPNSERVNSYWLSQMRAFVEGLIEATEWTQPIRRS